MAMSERTIAGVIFWVGVWALLILWMFLRIGVLEFDVKGLQDRIELLERRNTDG